MRAGRRPRDRRVEGVLLRRVARAGGSRLALGLGIRVAGKVIVHATPGLVPARARPAAMP
ncbi:MAG: hypothetical protein ACRC2B_03080 [Rubrivivax sp.]